MKLAGFVAHPASGSHQILGEVGRLAARYRNERETTQAKGSFVKAVIPGGPCASIRANTVDRRKRDRTARVVSLRSFQAS
jgi:hypothetical protein